MERAYHPAPRFRAHFCGHCEFKHDDTPADRLDNELVRLWLMPYEPGYLHRMIQASTA
jgi:hypothetical protein